MTFSDLIRTPSVWVMFLGATFFAGLGYFQHSALFEQHVAARIQNAGPMAASANDLVLPMRAFHDDRPAIITHHDEPKQVTGQLLNGQGDLIGTVERIADGDDPMLVVHDPTGKPQYVVEPIPGSPHVFRRYELTGPDIYRDREFVGETQADDWQAPNGERIYRHFSKGDPLAAEGEVVIFQPLQ